MYATVVFLLPLVKKMSVKISATNFCKFLAAVNFVAYNFGYHVHEKAILMTYIPLLLQISSNEDRARVKLIGFVMVFTFMPLIPGEFEAVIKNCLLALHYMQMDMCLDRDESSQGGESKRLKFYKLLLRITFWFVIVLQSFEFFYIILIKRSNEVLYLYYHTLVSVFAALVN